MLGYMNFDTASHTCCVWIASENTVKVFTVSNKSHTMHIVREPLHCTNISVKIQQNLHKKWAISNKGPKISSPDLSPQREGTPSPHPPPVWALLIDPTSQWGIWGH